MARRMHPGARREGFGVYLEVHGYPLRVPLKGSIGIL